jgi:leader peptidase (prepilin peptidase)/N-methyltransferase
MHENRNSSVFLAKPRGGSITVRFLCDGVHTKRVGVCPCTVPYNRLTFSRHNVDPLFATIAFVAGLVFGSFLNVCIYRLPRVPEEGEGLLFLRSLKSLSNPPRSACPKCGHLIRWYDNVPVLSWMLLRGRCRDCRGPISFRYAAVELLTGLLFLACFAKFDFTLETVKFCLFSFLLTGLIFTDAETKLLPDALTLPGLAAGIVFSVFVPVQDLVARFLPGIFPIADANESWQLLSFGDAVLGAAVGACFIYGSGMAYKLARGVEGMGVGDVKLMAMIGAFVGFKLTLFTIFGASILGALFGLSSIPVVWVKRTRRRMQRQGEPRLLASRRAWHSAKNVYRYYAMPFGVFLGTVALVGVFFGNALLNWYWSRYL